MTDGDLGDVVDAQGFEGTVLDAGAAVILTFDGISDVRGGTTVANGLTGGDLANDWEVTALDRGTLTGGVQTLAWRNFEDVTGNVGTDDFTLNGGTLSGAIDGGGGAGLNSLTGDNAVNTWNLTGARAGTLNGDGFTNIDALFGNAMVDTFNANALFGGSVDGQGTATDAGAAVIVTFDGIDTLTADAGNTNTLEGADLVNTWTVTGVDVGPWTSVSTSSGGTISAIFAVVPGPTPLTWILRSGA